MKRLACLIFAAALAFALPLPAQTDPKPIDALGPIMAKAREKAAQGMRSEAAYTAELQAFDDLAAKLHTDHPDDAARVIYLKAMMYVEIFRNNPKAMDIIKGIKRDFPNTEIGRKADDSIAQLTHKAEAEKNRQRLYVGAPFPDFMEKNIYGFAVNTATMRGKVLLLDFGATDNETWTRQVANLSAVYEKFHAQGLEMISVNLDTDPNKFKQYAGANGMKWSLICDGRGWNGNLAIKYGVSASLFPRYMLIDRYGNIFTINMAGSEFEAAVTKALAFKRPATAPAGQTAPQPAPQPAKP